MIPVAERGGKRTNISEMYSPLVNVKPLIEEYVSKRILKDLRVIADKVKFLFHDSEHFRDKNGFIGETDFYPLDKTLTQEEIEDINLHSLGIIPFENTALHLMTKVVINNLVRDIVTQFDKGAEQVVVHFSPADTLEHAGTKAEIIYGFISNGVLQLETAYYVEVVEYHK